MLPNLIVSALACISITFSYDVDTIKQALKDAVEKNRIAEKSGPIDPYRQLSSQVLTERYLSKEGDPEVLAVVSRAGRITLDFTKLIQERTGLPIFSPSVQEALDVLKPDIKAVCPVLQRKPCNASYPYRTPDGTCNHPDPTVVRGAAMTPQPRFLDSLYEDGINAPRSTGKNGYPLSSPRMISNVVLSTTPEFRSPFSDRFTVTLTHYGQFIDHDIIFTPDATRADPYNPYTEELIEDCDKDCCNHTDTECFPIPLPEGDSNFLNKFGTRCMHFVRRAAAALPDCQPGPRQQRNDRTSFVDLSSTYGSSETRYNDLRQFTGGRLNASKGDLLPFGPAVIDCRSGRQRCFSAGDDRHQVVPQLSVIHIVFLREHNRIAAELQEINPHWDDERLFQEAKKILTGMHQHIVYNEFLPMFVGQETARQKNLLSSEKGLKKTYNSNEDPSTVNEFGVAAYRVGHSLVGRFVNALDKNFHKEVPGEGEKLRKVFLDNTRIRDDDFGPDGIGRWMASTCMRERDRFISDQLRNHLFEDPVVSKVNKASDGFDLISINIQRARDHGIPGYNAFRKFCGLPPAKVFKTGIWGFVDHDHETVQRLAKVYSHPDDVELFVGGVSEKPSKNGEILGRTFKCLVSEQFRRMKFGDRFFYENDDNYVSFSEDQVNTIKKQTFASIYCRSLGLQRIQPKIFLKSGKYSNRHKECSQMPKPNLILWKDINYKHKVTTTKRYLKNVRSLTRIRTRINVDKKILKWKK